MARVGGTAKQIELHLPIWGGRRKRRRKRGRGENRKLRKVPHRRRPALSPKHPVHAALARKHELIANRYPGAMGVA